MKYRTQNRLFAGARVWLLALVTVSGAGAADDPGQNLKQLRKEINELQRELGGLHGRRDAIQKQLRITEKEIGQLTRTLQELDQKRQQQQSRLQELERQQLQQKAEIRRQYDALAAQLRAAYMIGRQEYLKMFLNQQEPQKTGRILKYHDYFNRARINDINEVRNRLAKLARLAARIEQERAQVEQLTGQWNRKKKALEKSKQARNRVLVAIKQDIGRGGDRLKQLLHNEQQLKKIVSRLRAREKKQPRVSGGSPFGADGRLPWPVEGVIKARFGSARTSELRWKGVLIAAEEGHPVRVIWSGKVVFADWLRGYGLLIIVDHGSGYMSLYGHNQSLRAGVGSRVEAGETISIVGNSGGQEQTGLYFEIRHNGQPVDPARWCVARK